LLLLNQGCAAIHKNLWAEVSLRNYRDHPEIKISKEEWQKSADIFEKESHGYSKEKKSMQAKALFCAGKVLQDSGKIKEAKENFSEAILLAPKWALPYHSIGTMELESGNFQKAKEMFEKAINLDPSWTTAITDLGVSYYHLSEPLRALEYFNLAISIDPSLAFIYSNKGNILASLGRYDEAVKSHMEAIKLEPHNPVFYINLLSVLEEIGDEANELWAYEKLKDLLPEKQKVPVMLKIAKLFEKMGRFEESLEELKKVTALAPNDKKVKEELKEFYLRRKLYSHAIQLILQEANQGCMECAKECFEIGNKLLSDGNLDGAELALNASVKIMPEWKEPLHNLGVVKYRKHDLDGALKIFEGIIKNNPNDFASTLNLSMVYYKMGKAADAMNWASKAISLSPESPLAHSISGEILRFAGNLKKSEEAHLKAINIAGSNCVVSARYSRFLIESGKRERAKEILDKISGEDCLEKYFSYALLSFDSGDFQSVLEKINLILLSDKSAAEAIALQGLVHFKQGKMDEAKEELIKAVCMEPRIFKEKRYQKALKKIKIPSQCNPPSN